MNPDPGTTDRDRELFRLWQEMPPPSRSADAAQLARELRHRTAKFDRRIFWRNFREYAAGAVMLLWFVWLSFHPPLRAIAFAGIAAVSFVMAYLWLSHRGTMRLDPAVDVKSYQLALLARYDHQIRLLKRVKYWYVLPAYLWMLLVIVSVPSRFPGGRVAHFVIVTAFALFVVWLNEGYGVRKLRAERRNTESLIREADQSH
jgi:hypothetical protein